MRTPADPLRFAVLSLIAAGVLAGGAYLAWQTVTGLGEQPCNANDTYSGWRIVGVAAAVFVLGHLAGRARLHHSRPAAEPARPVRTAAFTHALLLVFFVSVSIILVYETVSLWAPPGGDDSVNPWGLQPITHYVRCAKSVAPWRATVIVAVVSFFVGHWLWPPMTREPRPRAVGAES
jgi:hypothetical protein